MENTSFRGVLLGTYLAVSSAALVTSAHAAEEAKAPPQSEQKKAIDATQTGECQEQPAATQTPPEGTKDAPKPDDKQLAMMGNPNMQGNMGMGGNMGGNMGGGMGMGGMAAGAIGMGTGPCATGATSSSSSSGGTSSSSSSGGSTSSSSSSSGGGTGSSSGGGMGGM